MIFCIPTNFELPPPLTTDVEQFQELDLKILRSLASKEAEAQTHVTSRREKARADARWMKTVSIISETVQYNFVIYIYNE